MRELKKSPGQNGRAHLPTGAQQGVVGRAFVGSGGLSVDTPYHRRSVSALSIDILAQDPFAPLPALGPEPGILAFPGWPHE